MLKKEWLSATLLTLLCLVGINGGYTAIVWGLAQLTPQKGLGERIVAPDGQQYYYANIAQKFTSDRYFHPRPSAVDYNAAGSGGSNRGPANPDFLQTVSDRADSFLVHNPAVQKKDIPVALLTASGSGLDPDISAAAASVQVARVAAARGLPEGTVRELIEKHTDAPWGGLAPERVNVLRLNMDMDNLK